MPACFHTGMDEDLKHLIHRTLREAQALGKDYTTDPLLTLLVVRAVREARADITASEALATVNMVRQL